MNKNLRYTEYLPTKKKLETRYVFEILFRF